MMHKSGGSPNSHLWCHPASFCTIVARSSIRKRSSDITIHRVGRLHWKEQNRVFGGLMLTSSLIIVLFGYSGYVGETQLNLSQQRVIRQNGRLVVAMNKEVPYSDPALFSTCHGVRDSLVTRRLPTVLVAGFGCVSAAHVTSTSVQVPPLA
jgi:hypothetical protein